MAEFSKQYDELIGLGFHDFNIEEIFNSLENDHYISTICEGFGFDAIGKFNDKCMLHFSKYDQDFPEQWIAFDKYLEWFKKKIMINNIEIKSNAEGLVSNAKGLTSDCKGLISKAVCDPAYIHKILTELCLENNRTMDNNHNLIPLYKKKYTLWKYMINYWFPFF